MAQIVNARDLILQAISPRVATTSMSSNLTVDQSQVTGLGIVVAGTKMVFLAATTQVFQIAKSGVVSPASTVITASLKNLTNTPTLTVIGGTITPSPVLVSGSVTVPYANLISDAATIRLTVVQDAVTYTDEITIVKVREGIDGLMGFLSNEAHAIPADYLGNALSYAGATGNFKVYQGINDITSLCTFAIPAGGNTSGLTASINPSGAYAVTGAYPTNVQTVTLTLRATFGTTTLDKQFTIMKTNAAVPARTLSLISTSQVFQLNKAGEISPASIVFTSLQNSLTGTPVFSVTGTGASITSSPGSNQCTLTYAGMASNESVTVKVALNGYEDTATVIKVREGVDSILGVLTNESSVVAASSDGTVFSYTGTDGTFKVYQGITEKTGSASVAYSVVSMSNVNVLIASTGAYTVSALTQDSGTALLRATFGGVTLDKVYTIAKAKAGAAGQSTNGVRGSRTFYVTLTGTTAVFSDSLATTTASAEGGPVLNDIVTQYNTSQGFSQTKFYTAGGWVIVNAVVDGNLIVSGTIGAIQMQTNLLNADNVLTRGLTVRDSSGNIILSSAQALDYTKVGGTTKPANNATANQSDVTTNNAINIAATTSTWTGVTGAGRPADNATVGAVFGSNISGQITAASASTFIASAAIANAQIGTLDATKINTGYLSADRIEAGTITGNKLDVGFGGNLLKNSTWVERDGSTGVISGVPRNWRADYNSPNPFFYATPDNFVDWCPVGMNGVDMYQNSGPSAGTILMLSTIVAISATKRYEFSVYTGAHRCRVYTNADWLDVNSAVISNCSDFSVVNDEQNAGGKSLSLFKRIGHFGVAPANAASVRFQIIKESTKTGYTDSHAFLVAPMVATAGANQKVFSDYSPAGIGTKITGAGIETPSLSALSATIGLLRTAASGARMEVESNVLRVFDTNGTLRVKLGNLD